jgi:hypothetical protein
VSVPAFLYGIAGNPRAYFAVFRAASCQSRRALFKRHKNTDNTTAKNVDSSISPNASVDDVR